MSDDAPKKKGPKVREIFAEDYDEDVVDYASGLRRQALRAEREANGPPGSRHDIVVIHCERTRPAEAETSGSKSVGPAPVRLDSAFESDSDSSDAQPHSRKLGKLTSGLKRMLSKKSKAQLGTKSHKGPLATQPETDQADDQSTSQVARSLNDLDTKKRRQKFFSGSTKSRARRSNRSPSPSLRPISKSDRGKRRYGFIGGDDVHAKLINEFGLQVTPPKPDYASEEGGGSINTRAAQYSGSSKSGDASEQDGASIRTRAAECSGSSFAGPDKSEDSASI